MPHAIQIVVVGPNKASDSGDDHKVPQETSSFAKRNKIQEENMKNQETFGFTLEKRDFMWFYVVSWAWFSNENKPSVRKSDGLKNHLRLLPMSEMK